MIRMPHPAWVTMRRPNSRQESSWSSIRDDRLAVRSAVVDLAAQHAAPRHPLVARREVPDLGPPGWDLDHDILERGRQLLLRPEGVVEEIEDLLVAHLLDLGTDGEVGRRDVRFQVLDDGLLGAARDPYLVEPGDARLLHPHGDRLRTFRYGVPWGVPHSRSLRQVKRGRAIGDDAVLGAEVGFSSGSYRHGRLTPAFRLSGTTISVRPPPNSKARAFASRSSPPGPRGKSGESGGESFRACMLSSAREPTSP